MDFEDSIGMIDDIMRCHCGAPKRVTGGHLATTLLIDF